MTAIDGRFGKGEGRGAAVARLPGAVFLGILAPFFGTATGITIAQSDAMAAMGEVPMAGGWWMSGVWLPMCGQSWPDAAASFLGMWLAMTIAMMLPALTPTLWRYRQAFATAGCPYPDFLAAVMAAGYLAVWTGLGAILFVLGGALALAAIQAPALAHSLPSGGGVALIAAGAFQLSSARQRLLAACGKAPGKAVLAAAKAAVWAQGLRLGFRCCASCIAPMTALIVGGIMDLRLMALVTAAISAERLLPRSGPVGQAFGAGSIAAGALQLACRLA